MSLLSCDLAKGPPRVLYVQGEIDIGSADELRKALDEAFATDANVVVDLGGVTFIDAAGLRVILQMAESRNGAGPLVLVNASRVAWLLDLVELRDLPSILIREEGTVHGR